MSETSAFRDYRWLVLAMAQATICKKATFEKVSPYKSSYSFNKRVKRFELSTSTLARLRSTTELHPQMISDFY